jgi:hypothetical protein
MSSMSGGSLYGAPRLSRAGAAGADARRKGSEQPRVHAAEAAVAHDKRVVSGDQVARQPRDQRVQILGHVGAISQRSHRLTHVPAQVRRRIQPHLVGGAERARQGRLMHAKAHGLGARLEHRHDPFAADAAPQAVERGRDRGRVVRKVIVDFDPRRLSAQLHATGHSPEAPQRIDAALDRYTGMAGGRECRQRIVEVVRANQVPLQLTAAT